MQAGGRGGMEETLVQRPLVAVSPLVDVMMVSDLHNIAMERKTSKTLNYSRNELALFKQKKKPNPFHKLFYNLFNFLRIWPWDLSRSIMVPEYAEEPLAVGGGGVMRRTLAALGGLWESKAHNTVLTLLSKCSLGLPNVEGIAAPKSSRSDYLYYFFLM